MSIDKPLLQPENPSERFPLVPLTFRCDLCGQCYSNWKSFLNHITIQKHRVCYKCGINVGGMKEYRKGEYLAERFCEGNIEYFKYRHIECPVGNPSKRGR